MKHGLLFLLCLSTLGCASTDPPAGLLGAYRVEDGRTVSIRRSADQSLRYRIYESGASGRLYEDDANVYVSGPGFSQRDPVELVVRFSTDRAGVARRLDWQYREQTSMPGIRIGTEREIWFASDGVRLFGRLQLPDGPPPYPVVVLVHGSGDWPGTEWFYNNDFFVANGIAAFTYDKRGSGRSEGDFTFDFDQLAADALAAVDQLATVSEIDRDRIGLAGYSQGAWVAPLAASRHDLVRFVVANYGIIDSPAEEARLEMRQLLIDAGVSDDELQSADELIRAAIDVVASEFTSGWPRFEELKRKYHDAPWMDHLDGTPVGRLVAYPKFLVLWVGKRQLPDGMPWYYDSRELLEHSEIPMAWLLAEQDRSAPNVQTIATLRSLIDTGKPYSLTLFPNADHGMLTYEEKDGRRVYDGYAPGYFQSEVEAVKGFLDAGSVGKDQAGLYGSRWWRVFQ